MSRKLAVKKLTASDLTIFEWHFRNRNAGNQKAINLNAEPFISKLYPVLPDLANELSGKVPLDLHIYGPGTNQLHNLQRKIIKGGTYKNWRLNGEFIHNPTDFPDRYNILVPDDIAIIEFYGIDMPSSAKLILLANSLVNDQPLIGKLNTLLGNKTMIEISPKQLEELTKTTTNADHPILELNLDENIEEAIYSGDLDIKTIESKPSLRKLSKEDFNKSKKSAEDNGIRGEEVVNAYFEMLVVKKEIISFEWVSEKNPIYPYDFIVTTKEGKKIYVEVKSTDGDFDRKFYISTNELKQILDVDKYEIYRVYHLDENKAKVRIALDLKTFAKNILKVFNQLPEGIKSTGVIVTPKNIDFGGETVITVEQSEEI